MPAEMPENIATEYREVVGKAIFYMASAARLRLYAQQMTDEFRRELAYETKPVYEYAREALRRLLGKNVNLSKAIEEPPCGGGTNIRKQRQEDVEQEAEHAT